MGLCTFSALSIFPNVPWCFDRTGSLALCHWPHKSCSVDPCSSQGHGWTGNKASWVRKTIQWRKLHCRKTNRVFSAIAIDHAHEQNKAHIKGDGGAVDLTYNPSALWHWVVAGPEVARVIDEFYDQQHHCWIKVDTCQTPSIPAAFPRMSTLMLVWFKALTTPLKNRVLICLSLIPTDHTSVTWGIKSLSVSCKCKMGCIRSAKTRRLHVSAQLCVLAKGIVHKIETIYSIPACYIMQSISLQKNNTLFFYCLH